MRIYSNIVLPNNIGLSILEADAEIIVKKLENRFLLVLEIDGKRILPKTKKKFVSVDTNYYFYPVKSWNDGVTIFVGKEAYLELQLCDRSLEDCNTELMKYISIYNSGVDVKKALKKYFKF